MRIGFDAKRALNNKTGLGNYSRQLISGLSKNYAENEYFLFTPKVSAFALQEIEGVYSTILPEGSINNSFSSWWRTFGLKKELERYKINLYHGLSNELPFGVNRQRTKTAVTIHDLIFLHYPEDYFLADRAIYKAKTAYAVKHADRVIAVSQETKHDLIHTLGVNESKIDIVYPICQLAPSSSQEIPTPEKKYLLNVGSLVNRKNQVRLIESYATIADKIEEELWIVGNGRLLLRLKQMIKQLKLENRVKLLTEVSNDQLYIIFKNATAFVYPSLKEGFGMPISEAQQLGVPVVTALGGATEEAAGIGSLFFDPLSIEDMAAKMLQVVSDEKLRSEISRFGLLHVSQMQPKVLTEKLMRIYNKLV